ncbi:30S ribosomal protein S3 [Patescibacteria group bacterium]
MGQKVNPTGFRTGNFLPWKSRWFTDNKNISKYLIEDIKIRNHLMKKLRPGGVTSVEIERLPKSMVITVTVSRPGVVIGRGGTGITDTKKEVLSIIRKMRKKPIKNLKIDMKVNEVKNPELSAQLVASRIVDELQRRIPHRRVIARTMDRVMSSGALGVKIILSGRIGGAEISRREKYHRGSVPTQTLRKNIDYAETPALLKRGYVGVKVFIHKKEED